MRRKCNPETWNVTQSERRNQECDQNFTSDRNLNVLSFDGILSRLHMSVTYWAQIKENESKPDQVAQKTIM